VVASPVSDLTTLDLERLFNTPARRDNTPLAEPEAEKIEKFLGR